MRTAVGHDDALNLEIRAFRDLSIGAFRDFGFDVRIPDPRPRDTEGDKRETRGRQEGDRGRPEGDTWETGGRREGDKRETGRLKKDLERKNIRFRVEGNG